jgi:hypothetical protein
MAARSVFLSETSAADQDPGRNLDCDNPRTMMMISIATVVLVIRVQLR